MSEQTVEDEEYFMDGEVHNFCDRLDNILHNPRVFSVEILRRRRTEGGKLKRVMRVWYGNHLVG